MLRVSKLIRRLIVVAPVLALASHVAEAHRVSVDFSTAPNGEYFLSSPDVNHFGQGSGAVPFQLNLGDGLNDYNFCFNNNGFVQFVVATSSCSLSTTLPASNYIAPFFTTLTPNF